MNITPEVRRSTRSSIRNITPDVRQSTRSTKGEYSTRYINEVFLTEVLNTNRSHYDSQFAYLAELQTDLDSGIIT